MDVRKKFLWFYEQKNNSFFKRNKPFVSMYFYERVLKKTLVKSRGINLQKNTVGIELLFISQITGG